MPEYKGTSKKGNIQDALKQALEHAIPKHPDGMVNYVVKQIRGRKGGIAGFNEVVVVIKTTKK
jgi:hypothetical protein